jgi:trimethylamine--corrinoid protein Co-methyltransferase
MKSGSPAGTLRFLSDGHVDQLHHAALALLQDPGMYCESDLVLDIFARAGARVDRDRRIITVAPDMVNAARATAPARCVLYGLDPELDLLVEPGRVYFGMGGSSEPFFWDHALGRPRRPTKADVVACTRVGQALPNIDFIMTMCQSGDFPVDHIFFHDTDAIVRNTTKPICYSVLDRRHLVRTLEIVAAACGGETAFRQRPQGLGFVTPVSPLVFPKLVEGIVDAIEWGVPILYSPAPMMSGTGPATIAGTLALTIAEFLFGLVLTQLLRPGAPVLFKTDADVMDPATGQCTYGSPEQALGKAALAQVCAFYRIPCFTMGGGAESKLPDSEAAAQAMLGMLMNGLAGITLSQSLGTLAHGLYGSLEQLLICDEMAHMVKRVLAGFAVDDETLALAAIRGVGHGGDFLTDEHTLAHFRQELFFPALFKRQSVEQWLERGAQSVVDVAHARVEAILAASGPVALPPGAEEALARALDAATREDAH